MFNPLDTSFRPIAPPRKARAQRISKDESDTQAGSGSASANASASVSASKSASASASRSASAPRAVSPRSAPLVSDTEPMVRRKINYATSKKFMQEYMYDGKIKRAPSVFLGPKKRYYTDPRGDSTFSYEESVAQQNMQGKTRSELRQMGAVDVSLGVPRRLIESNFLITINPNRKWGAEGEDAVARHLFNKTMQQLTSQQEFFSILKVPQSTRATATSPDFSGHYRNDDFSDVVNDTDIKGVVEIGETQRRMHAHVMIAMKHYGMIQMCPKTIKTNFTQFWNKLCQSRAYRDYGLRKGPYVDVQLL